MEKQKLYETRRHGTPRFPMECFITRTEGIQHFQFPLHWHRNVEIMQVLRGTDETLLHWTINALNRHGYTCLQAKNAPAGLPHLQVIAPDALYLTRDGKHRTFTSFGKLLEEIK